MPMLLGGPWPSTRWGGPWRCVTCPRLWRRRQGKGVRLQFAVQTTFATGRAIASRKPKQKEMAKIGNHAVVEGYAGLTQIAHSPERPDCRSASCTATASGAGGDAAIVAAPFSAFNAAYCTGRASACTSGRHDTRQPPGTGRQRLSCSLCAGKTCLGEIRPPCAVWTSVHSASLRFPWFTEKEQPFFLLPKKDCEAA